MKKQLARPPNTHERRLARVQWLAEKRDEIVAGIELGFAEAQRGELIDGDEVRSRMAARKKAWMAGKRQA